MNTNRLRSILRLARHHDSVGEKHFCNLIERYLSPTIFYGVAGNVLAYSYTVHKLNGTKYPVMWSCHLDTVHGVNAEPQQDIVFDDTVCMVAATKGREVLGADDGAGIWLLLEMIDAKVPGTYVFHRGEECGGIGSKGIQKLYPEFLTDFTHAIAFDRKNGDEIITHQAFGRCCSDEFATHFASLIGMEHTPSPLGRFTDTANYIHDIHECSNVSIGYESEHTVHEILDLEYMFALRNQMVKNFVTAPKLKIGRDVNDVEEPIYHINEIFNKWRYT